MIELLKIGTRTSTDTNYYKKFPAPQHSRLVYQSAKMGFDNLWQLWLRDDSVAIISVRGTTKTSLSFLANLYAAMVSAKGTLILEKDFTFNYNLSDNPKAAVHVGFLMAMAYLSRDILPKIDSCYRSGIHEFIITGHSQGGAITYTLTSYLEELKKEGRLQNDIRFKTCASAAPKPGNLFYAYEFETLTRDGWSYNLVNTIDWVPEFPLSIQTLQDLNTTNPLRNAKKLLRKQKFPVNVVLLHAYRQLSQPLAKAQRNYQKWLGKRMAVIVKKNLEAFTAPTYYGSNNYVRTGVTIPLYPDSAYYHLFPENPDSVWHNHLHAPYLYLMGKLRDNGNVQSLSMTVSPLHGSWELEYIAGRKISLDSLFPQKKPLLNINSLKNELSGNTGCNLFSGKLQVDGEKISFPSRMTMTMMACPGEGEQVFLAALKSVSRYAVNANSLTLISDDIAIMSFKKL